MKDFDPVLISLVRRSAPSRMASELAGVQPMTAEDIFPLTSIPTCNIEHEFGDRIHSFIEGWCQYNGERFVADYEIYNIHCDLFLHQNINFIQQESIETGDTIIQTCAKHRLFWFKD